VSGVDYRLLSAEYPMYTVSAVTSLHSSTVPRRLCGNIANYTICESEVNPRRKCAMSGPCRELAANPRGGGMELWLGARF